MILIGLASYRKEGATAAEVAALGVSDESRAGVGAAECLDYSDWLIRMTLRRPTAALGTRILRIPFSSVARMLSVSTS
jgi:hypothetical protein